MKLSEPTMGLNFANMSQKEIKMTIIHQFGHALGLGHALMKPQYWEAIKKFVDVNVMMRSYGVNSLADFETQWTGNGLGENEVNYDEESVMGYRYNAIIIYVVMEIATTISFYLLLLEDAV